MAMDLSRITLRPFKLSDVDDFMLWAGDERVTQKIRMNTFRSREQGFAFIRDVYIPHPWCRAICINDRCIGAISVSPCTADDKCRAELGYCIATEYWGRGLTTQVVRMVLSQVFTHFPDLVRLEAFVAVENKASQRVLEKAGFLREGLLRKYAIVKGNIKDVVIFSFLSTIDPPPSPPLQ